MFGERNGNDINGRTDLHEKDGMRLSRKRVMALGYGSWERMSVVELIESWMELAGLDGSVV